MKTNKVPVVFAIAALMLSMLACNLGKATSGATEVPQGNDTQANSTEAPAGNKSAAACGNPYIPIVVGATWNYNLTGAVPDTFTRSIVSIEAGGFTDQDVFGTGVTRQSKWTCDNGALTALDPGGNTSNVSSENVQVDFQTTSASGVTLPAVLNPGDSWNQAVTLEGTETINGETLPAKNEFTNTCTVAGKESITVAAGTFDAVRVDCNTSMAITITMNGSPISQPISFTATSWYAEKVGLLKTVTAGNGLDSTVELTSYSIP